MRSKKVMLTVLAVMLGGFTQLSYAAQRLVNLDYLVHGVLEPSCPGSVLADYGSYDLTDSFPPDGISDSESGQGAGAIPYLDSDPPVLTNPGCLPLGVSITGFHQTSGVTVSATLDSGIIDSNETAGRFIALETLQGTMGTIPAGTKADGQTLTPKYAGVMYTIDGIISDLADVTFTLSNGKFAENPWFAVYVGAGGTDFKAWTWTTGGNNATSVTYRLTATAAAPLGDNTPPAPDSAKLFLLYRIKDASELTKDNGKVVMSVDIKTGSTPVSNLGSGEVTIFTAKSALTAKITSETKNKKSGTYISVGDDNKLITDNEENTEPANDAEESAFRNVTTARIGYLELGGEYVFEPDGVTLFTIGEGRGEVNETESELVITSGQFAASKQGAGKVRLLGINKEAGTSTPIASQVASDDNTVTFLLTNDLLASIGEYDTVAIEFIADTTNPINLVEAPPKATLTLKFADDSVILDEAVTAALIDVELRQLFQNGTVCWAFNLPAESIKDDFNIRITNESSIPGTFAVTLYQADGTPKAEAVELTGVEGLVTAKAAGEGTDDTAKVYLMPENTIHLNSAKLQAALGDVTWDNRAVAKFVTELPTVEMLAMLRNKLMDESSQPLNNFSLGAHGKSCIQGGQ